uniref:PWWP domain-containing protein n=1 Tax=Haemonchus contortus TaxID=6289 RepID=A0A7I4Y0V6_HAECO
MVKSSSEIRKGDVIWAPYRRDPLWPALVRNSYPKKVTYIFFPLPRSEASENSSKKTPTFSCQPKAVRALSIDDVLPSHSTTDLIEAFEAAIEYLNKKGLPTGSAAPRLITKTASQGTETMSFRNSARHFPNDDKKIKASQDVICKPEMCAGSQSFANQVVEGGIAKVGDESNKAKRKPLPSSPSRAPAFAADSTTHSDTSPSPDLLAPTIFREAVSILERIWATDLVQNYVTPPRSALHLETHTGGLLSDHETDSLFDLIFFWVRDREHDSYFLPGVHLVLEVLMPEVIIQALVQARGISREAAERMVRYTPSESSCSSSTSNEVNSDHSFRNSGQSSAQKSGGSLDELARIACKERESFTE